MLKIHRLWHAGLLFESDQTRIVFDPIFENPFSVNCYVFPELAPSNQDLSETVKKFTSVDAVIISHIHDDHFSLASLNHFNRDTEIYIYSKFSEAVTLLLSLGFRKVRLLDEGFSLAIGDFLVSGHQSQYPDVDQIYEIEVEGLRILNLVDSFPGEASVEYFSKNKYDLLITPFQCMRELEILCPQIELDSSVQSADPLQKINILNARYVLAGACQFKFEKWSWLNFHYFKNSYAAFRNAVISSIPFAQPLQLAPLKTMIFNNKELTLEAPRPECIHNSANQAESEDYDFNLNSPVPTTSEVSQHFIHVSDVEFLSLVRFLETILVETYSNLESSDSPYFAGTWNYSITLWNGPNQQVNKYYEVSGSLMELLDKAPAEVHWRSEIVASKLLGAISGLETLSSLYLRLNDPRNEFAPRKDIQFVSPIEDPLIRVLFDDKPFSYQKSQLKILTSRN